MGTEAFHTFVSSISGVLGIGALTTRVSVGLPASAIGLTNDDEVLLYFQKILIKLAALDRKMNDVKPDELMKFVVDVIANDDAHV